MSLTLGGLDLIFYPQEIFEKLKAQADSSVAAAKSFVTTWAENNNTNLDPGLVIFYSRNPDAIICFEQMRNNRSYNAKTGSEWVTP